MGETRAGHGSTAAIARQAYFRRLKIDLCHGARDAESRPIT
jgi:hypothetical protein